MTKITFQGYRTSKKHKKFEYNTHDFYQQFRFDCWGAYNICKLKEHNFPKKQLHCINIHIRPYVHDYSHQTVITLHLSVLKIFPTKFGVRIIQVCVLYSNFHGIQKQAFAGKYTECRKKKPPRILPIYLKRFEILTEDFTHLFNILLYRCKFTRQRKFDIIQQLQNCTFLQWPPSDFLAFKNLRTKILNTVKNE